MCLDEWVRDERIVVMCADCNALLGKHPAGVYADCEECGGFTLSQQGVDVDGPSDDDIAAGDAAERDAFLTRERIAVATALDVPYATPLGEAVATRLARLTAERDTARIAHAELAAAVRAEREAEAAHAEAAVPIDPRDAFTSLMSIVEGGPPSPAMAALAAAGAAREAARKAVDALLAAAPPRSTVPAALAREYLAALDGRGSGELADDYSDAVREVDARAALDAALAGCV